MKTAVILGVGGLGCPAALALSELDAGIRLRLVDPDRVDRSNLARQILFREADIGAPKAAVAARQLRNAEPRIERFDAKTGPALLLEADVLLDGTDDFETRFLANDLAVRSGVPLVHGAVLGWTGHLLIVLPGRTGCLRCLFEGPPAPGSVPTCAEAGVLSPLCGLVGTAMAAAAVPFLDKKINFLSRGETLEPSVLYRWDARAGSERPLAVKRDPGCAACGSAASNPGRST